MVALKAGNLPEVIFGHYRGLFTPRYSEGMVQHEARIETYEG